MKILCNHIPLLSKLTFLDEDMDYCLKNLIPFHAKVGFLPKTKAWIYEIEEANRGWQSKDRGPWHLKWECEHNQVGKNMRYEGANTLIFNFWAS